MPILYLRTDAQKHGNTSQRVITMNDCQIQTDEGRSASEKNMISEIKALHNRISIIEDVIEEKDIAISQLREINESFLKQTMVFDKADSAIQVHIPMEPNIPESEFTREEVDEILFKLK